MSKTQHESEVNDMRVRMKCMGIATFITDRLRFSNFWFNISVLLSTCLIYTIYNCHQMVNHEQPLRILSIGDSLAEGSYNHGERFHPYATHLKHLFEVANISVEMEKRGRGGERVVQKMKHRLRYLLSENVLYDWIIILGGTNDLKYNVSAESIFKEGLEPMYTMCLNHGQAKIKLVVMTVLEIGHDLPSSDKDKNRRLLNTMIRDFVAKTADHNRISLVDLDKGIPYHTAKNDQERKRIWDEPIHLTPVGYDYMATLVFDAMKNKL